MSLREKKEKEVLKTEHVKPKETLEELKESEEQIPGQMEYFQRKGKYIQRTAADVNITDI